MSFTPIPAFSLDSSFLQVHSTTIAAPSCISIHSSHVDVPFHLSFTAGRNLPFSVRSAIACCSSELRRPLKAVSESRPSAAVITDVDVDEEKEKSVVYSRNMTDAMGAVLTYRHELGMNYDFISPNFIVGSCLQSPEDVDKLRKLGVKTIFCLQQDSDLEYFGVDIDAIQDYANRICIDIQHLRMPIRDFDSYDLRVRLPVVVSKLQKAISRNGGLSYIHCTAGLGRAPAVAIAYMFWIQGYELHDAHNFLVNQRFCYPKMEAIKSATADILTGFRKKHVTFKWQNEGSSVEISGLDVGWGQKVPLIRDAENNQWILRKELLEGCYQYKYIVDGEWLVNQSEPITAEKHANNYVQVRHGAGNTPRAFLRARLTGDDPHLTKNERAIIKRYLHEYPNHG